MSNVEKLIGKEVIYTGEEEPRQNTVFVVGECYKVGGLGKCSYGEGVKIDGSDFIIVHGNYKIVKPKPLTLNEFLKAIDNNETVVSVDVDDKVIDSFKDFFDLEECLTSYEAENCKFYLKNVWEEFETLNEIIAEFTKKHRHVSFAEALKHLADGKTVAVYIGGKKHDEYKTPNDLYKLMDFEIEKGEWYVIE